VSRGIARTKCYRQRAAQATGPLQRSVGLLATHGALLQCSVTRQHSVVELLLYLATQQLSVMLRMGVT
jgi:hypothetical protein